tara:strand:+ start:326 stop:448 length:123 start_codon:yes stop_codon:yes gene_type:complete
MIKKILNFFKNIFGDYDALEYRVRRLERAEHWRNKYHATK